MIDEVKDIYSRIFWWGLNNSEKKSVKWVLKFPAIRPGDTKEGLALRVSQAQEFVDKYIVDEHKGLGEMVFLKNNVEE